METALQVSSKNNVMVNPERFSHVFKISQVFANSQLVPEHFQGKPENVFVALQFAERLDLDPMTALQNIYIVKGRPCLSSQMLIALANTSGLLDGVITFENNGKNPPELAVTAKAKLKSGQVVSATYAYSQAVKMGTSNNVPWQSAPEQMCCYRAASHLVRRYFPELSLGLGVKEEIEELPEEPRNVTPVAQVDRLNSLLAAAPAPVAKTADVIEATTEEPKKRGRPKKVEVEQVTSTVELMTETPVEVEAEVEAELTI